MGIEDKIVEVRYSVKVPFRFNPDDGLSAEDKKNLEKEAENCLLNEGVKPEIFIDGEFYE